MTVCIGVLCEEKSSVVLVADRMVTSGLAIEFEHPVRNKLTGLSENCNALTSGDAYAFTELFDEVRSRTVNRRSTTVEEYVEIIKDCYQTLRHKQIVERILKPRGFDGFKDFYQAQAAGLSDNISLPMFNQIEMWNYRLEILVGGLSPAGGHLYVIHDPGTSHCLDSIGFHVIGSGTNLALSSLIANQCHQEMPEAEALLTALNAKMTAENAPGVGAKTDVSLIRTSEYSSFSPKTVQFTDEEIIQFRDLCKKKRAGDDNYLSDCDTILKQKFSLPLVDTDKSDRIHKGAADEHDGQPKSDGEQADPAVPAFDQVSVNGGQGESGPAN